MQLFSTLSNINIYFEVYRNTIIVCNILQLLDVWMCKFKMFEQRLQIHTPHPAVVKVGKCEHIYRQQPIICEYV